jgi:hypothetical protein
LDGIAKLVARPISVRLFITLQEIFKRLRVEFDGPVSSGLRRVNET